MLKNSNKVLIIYIIMTLLLIEPVYAINCDGILTPGAYQMLQDAINIIRIAVPILLIVLGSVDLGSVVISQDKDAMPKAVGKLVKRCICAVAIFFVPLIVKTILNMPGIKGNVNLVDAPLCGIE